MRLFFEGGGKTLPDRITMNAINLREAARPKLSLRYGAIHPAHTHGERASPGPMPIAELRRLVATMID